MQLQVGVKVLLKNSEGKYLLLRRTKQLDGMQIWDMPGGRIDPGTTLMENLAREIMEETGLVMTGAPRLVAAQDILVWADRHVVRLTYIGEGDGMPTLSDEHDEFGWFTPEELRRLEPLDTYLKTLMDAGVAAV